MPARTALLTAMLVASLGGAAAACPPEFYRRQGCQMLGGFIHVHGELAVRARPSEFGRDTTPFVSIPQFRGVWPRDFELLVAGRSDPLLLFDPTDGREIALVRRHGDCDNWHVLAPASPLVPGTELALVTAAGNVYARFTVEHPDAGGSDLARLAWWALGATSLALTVVWRRRRRHILV